MAKAEIRMTEGPIAKQLVSFAIPLFLGFLFQQLYNTADALIVGNLLGNSALAAVTGTGTLIFLLVGFFGGISMGAGVVVSRFFGSREVEKMRAAIHTNIAFGMAAGVFLTVVGMLFTPQILQWMGTPEDVMPQSVAYIRTYFAGSIGLVMYNQCRGVMQAVGDSRHPLYYLIISSITNVVLDILLIAVFKMDVDGAALATIFSQGVSVEEMGEELLQMVIRVASGELTSAERFGGRELFCVGRRHGYQKKTRDELWAGHDCDFPF